MDISWARVDLYKKEQAKPKPDEIAAEVAKMNELLASLNIPEIEASFARFQTAVQTIVSIGTGKRGGYYDKYLKYKMKYIALKKQASL